MRYDTKKEILEAYGKSGKNVRWLDKAIQRGFIIERNGQYAFRRDVEQVDISGLKEENERLRREIGELKKNGGEDLKDHLKFFYEMDLARKAAMEKVVQGMFNKNQGAGWDEAIIKANKFMEFEPNPLEGEEIEYVGGLNL